MSQRILKVAKQAADRGALIDDKKLDIKFGFPLVSFCSL